ncbi:response regulator [Niastella populi]|uniref:histidine kinase n=1 Tax=Niastella populi TaxID=550983 RepID=A0A1V9EFM5_9BACT|nr:response regulator [Niastella populi]OQP44913.1 hypothetical protein A4R26_32475 [Niastella populi]
MRFIQNLSIRSKLLLISLMPLAALFYFLLQNIRNEIAARNRIKQVYNNVLAGEAISNVIHQLQQERGYSISYLLGKGKEEKSELFTQREKTDNAIFNLTQLINSDKNDAGWLSTPDSLSALRTEVNSLQTNPETIRNVFAGIIFQKIKVLDKTFRSSREADIKDLLATHMFLIYSKEYYGQLRAAGKEAILLNGFGRNSYAEFAALKGKYEINLEKFRNSAPDELADLFDWKMTTPAIKMVQKMIDTAYHLPVFTGFPFSVDDWWINGIMYLNTFKEIVDASNLLIRRTAESKLAAISGSMTQSIIIALVVVLFIALLLFFTIRSIVSSVMLIKNTADRFTMGEINLSVPVISKDEIGSLANSFNQLIKVSQEYAEAAEIIGKGDYTPEVRVRSEADKLGISLNNMKSNLQKLSHENEIRTWLLSGNNEINDKMRGELEIRELAKAVICQLTKYLKAQVGSIYLSENGHLNLTGSYAFHHRKENVNHILAGQGLVGQAALEKTPIIFEQVPDDYTKINSSLGNTLPKNIVVYPFLYDGEVKGVIEIGAVHNFSELDLQFLDLVNMNIGIAFNSSQSRTRLKELLEETQRQAEELEMQQEELKQTNEELQEKTQLLEKSEAELKTQQEELQQSNEELEEKANLLQEQKEKLETAKMEVETKARELEVTSKYKSEFLANMSHELRTPLNSILILSQILTENKNKVLGEKEIELTRNIYNSGTDLLNLINEILDLSKVEAGRMELEIGDVPFNSISENLRAMFSEVANARSIVFEIICPQEIISTTIRTDRQRVEQILRNLLSNAFKFTDKGGQVILQMEIITPADVFSDGKLLNFDKVAAFSVTDTGIGIPESKQHIIFHAFQQADGSTKRKYGGTGLGLSISRELAHALGGDIHLHSEDGKGSIFTLYIPLKFDPIQAQRPGKGIEIKKAGKTAGKSRNLQNEFANGIGLPENIKDDRYTIGESDRCVLIIEDDENFATILLKFVNERNYKGIIALQGNTGLSLARHYRPDAIILDMQLPVMDGAEVLKQLKHDPDLRHIPVQIISAYDRRIESLELGAFDFIRKPVDKAAMQTAFERIEEFVRKKLKKLLIVEDNQEHNNAIRELIGNGDVKSASAYSGNEAFELMQKERFDCVIIDLGLPDMSGIDLIEKIKTNEDLNKVPIIVYTGKELSREKATRLNKLANSIVLKTANSKERLLDETILFLHRVESNLPKEKQQIIRKLHHSDEVLVNRKVLLVDDDIRNIFSLTTALEEDGMRCITAENGKEAIKVLKEQADVDIVLMDVMMPEMDGYEATREIRKMSQFSKLPILALTAKAMKGDREKCLEAGMSDYIAKPVNIEQLLSLMRVWLYQQYLQDNS